MAPKSCRKHPQTNDQKSMLSEGSAHLKYGSPRARKARNKYVARRSSWRLWRHMLSQIWPAEAYWRGLCAENKCGKNNHYPTLSGVVPNIVSDIAKPAVELQYIKDFINQRQSKNCMTHYSLSIENLNSPRH